ncbi:MAG: glutamate ligase domain-containing protein, partial [Acidimicrobiales bacterium]
SGVSGSGGSAAAGAGAGAPEGAGGPDYHEGGGFLRRPGGEPIMAVAELWRGLPHDRANALAACAAALAAGATPEACRSVLSSFEGLHHRVELVGEAGGVAWYDDSKATTPASVLAALAGFDSVVLIAGGRNKGLDLTRLGEGAGRVRAVVAIGESAGEVEAAFAAVTVPGAASGRPGRRPEVRRAGSMAEAVEAAAAAARPGDAVLLSPGCASFDWYGSYRERGQDFARLVGRRIGSTEVVG